MSRRISCRINLSTLLFILLLSIISGILVFPSITVAQPTTIIVPYAPGGSSDVLARVIASKTGNDGPVVIENRAGAGGEIGLRYLISNARSDGRTYLLLTNGLVSAVLSGSSKNLFDDVQAVSLLGITGYSVTVREGSFNSLQQLINQGRGRELTFGFASRNGIDDILGRQFIRSTGIRAKTVYFSGSGESLTALLGGHVDVCMMSTPAIEPHVKAGKLLPLAVTLPYRASAFPQVSTLEEQGIQGVMYGAWNALVTKRDVHASAISPFLNRLKSAFANDDLRRQCEKIGIDVIPAQDIDLGIAERFFRKQIELLPLSISR